MKGWAIDIGTTNTGIACWDDDKGQPRLIELPRVCRRPGGDDPLEAPVLIPSVVEFLSRTKVIDRIGAWRPLEHWMLLGSTALIGQPALNRNQALANPAFVPGFKTALAWEPTRPVARVDRRVVTAREAARAFLRELFAEVKRETGDRIRDLVATVPVDAYEGYRAQLQDVARSLGVRRLRFVDEPLAAALGYGLGIASDRNVLVVDVGGGTMHVALLRLTAAGVEQGHAEILAKQGRALGGDTVDSWLLDHVCRRMGYSLDEPAESEEMRLWRRLMLAEACRVKEALFFRPAEEFLLTPPGVCRVLRPDTVGLRPAQVTRDDLVEALREGGFYAALTASVESALAAAPGGPMAPADVHDVLMVGGSTLLPNVFSILEERFERHRVRAWQPFDADRYAQVDFIVHDYAFVTHRDGSHEPEYTVVVPRGTRFPTRPDFWKAQVRPTCSLGVPETLFKLVVCEIGRAQGDGRRFVWDAAGDLHKVGGKAGGEGQVVVPLNDASPALGELEPPHAPRDRRPRLEIAFGVDDDRWLIATVVDLLTQRTLMDRQPVVRLL